MEIYPGAEALVEVINSWGVDFIFMNPGIDTVPLQVTISKFKSEGKRCPGIILCLDESVAMAAAHGHYMVSGKPQVVLVHRELGTQQVGGAMHNAYFGRVPVILCGGLSPSGARQTWQQKPFDQGSIVRNCVKWEHEVAASESLAGITQKAFELATTEPCGPVYLAPSLETFKQEMAVPTNQFKQLTKKADIETLNQAAAVLLASQNPLILAGHSGRHHQSMTALVELAEILGARVFNGPVRLNFPTSHPLCAGIDPIGGGNRADGHYISEADTVFLVDYDLPYAAGGFAPSPSAKIICLDIDPAKKIHPTWGRKAEVHLEASSQTALPDLIDILKKIIQPATKQQIDIRSKKFDGEHLRTRTERQSQAVSKANRRPISPDWLCHCIDQVVDQDSIIVNQTITHSGFVGEQILRSKPGTFLSCAGGSIGWPLGAGLGARLAAPDKTIVSLMGDGAFVWGCPTASLWASNVYHAPFLAIIFNNETYAAIKGLVQRSYGAEALPSQVGFDSGVNITPPPDYSGIARACGAFGKKVDDPLEVLPALQQAMEVVRSGKTAVVDVKLAYLER